MIKYTHPNLLFISWQHYLPRYQRTQIKKKTGNTVNEFGQIIKKGDANKKNTNTLLMYQDLLKERIIIQP